MKKVLSIALNDLRILLSESGVWVFMLIIPAVLVFVIGLANGAFALETNSTPAPVIVDFVDADNSDISRQLADNIKRINPRYVLCPSENTPENACGLDADAVLDAGRVQSRLESGASDAYVEIPAGFGASLDAGQSMAVIFRSNEDIQNTSPTFETLQAAVQRLNGAITARQIAADVAVESLDNDPEFASQAFTNAAAIWETNPVTVERIVTQIDAETAAEAAPGFRQSVPGIGSMYVMFTVLAGVTMLITERKNRTLQRVMAMPVSNGEVIAGKMLGRMFIGMMQFGVAFGVGMLLGAWQGFGFGNVPALILIMLAFVFCIAALALLLGTWVRTEQQANGVTTMLALTLAPLGGAWWSLDLEFIPEFMRMLSYISPVRYAMQGFQKVIMEGGNIIDVLPQVGVLAAAGLVLFALGAWRFEQMRA